jgi:hypothetical protein
MKQKIDPIAIIAANIRVLEKRMILTEFIFPTTASTEIEMSITAPSAYVEYL